MYKLITGQYGFFGVNKKPPCLFFRSESQILRAFREGAKPGMITHSFLVINEMLGRFPMEIFCQSDLIFWGLTKPRELRGKIIYCINFYGGNPTNLHYPLYSV